MVVPTRVAYPAGRGTLNRAWFRFGARAINTALLVRIFHAKRKAPSECSSRREEAPTNPVPVSQRIMEPPHVGCYGGSEKIRGAGGSPNGVVGGGERGEGVKAISRLRKRAAGGGERRGKTDE